MSMSERLSLARPRTQMKLERAAGNRAEMRRAGIVSLLPLPCLLLIAVLAQAWNVRHHPFSAVTPTAPVHVTSTKNQRDTPALRQELKTVLLHYRTLRGAEQQEATHKQAWARWQNSLDGRLVSRRLARLRSWPDFSVHTIEWRESGFVTVLLECDGESLKAWFVPGQGGWKLAGLVKPTLN